MRLAYDLRPASDEETWLGLSVFAIDGAKYRLRAADALRKAFDPDSGLDHPGQGHDPQCLVSTVDDVFRRLPIARTVQSIAHANEREEIKVLSPQIPLGGVLLFDRGYPGYDLIDSLLRRYRGSWVIRCPAAATFPAVEAFVQSGQTEFRRWAVEPPYRDETTSLDIQTFHSQTESSVRQELFAVLIMAVIARLLMVWMTDSDHPARAEPRFKHAMITLAEAAFVLTPTCPAPALLIFTKLLNEIARVRYDRPKTPRPLQPRVSKQPINQW